MTAAGPSRRKVLKYASLGLAATKLSPGLLFPRPSSAQNARSASGRGGPIMRRIPKTGEMIPAVGLGTFETFDVKPGQPRDNVREVIRLFHAAGGKVIDTSPLYGMSEVNVGDFITDLGIGDRMFITNKTWTTGDYLSDNSHSERQLNQSRERLWRDKLDVLQVHSLENHDQVRHWLAQKKKEGSVRYVGATQWSPEYYDTLERLAGSGTLDFVQLGYTIVTRAAERRLLDACAANGVAVQVNIPFEKARLFTPVTGRLLPDFAAEFGIRSWSQYFLKWIISHPAVTNVIPATSQPGHVVDNMGALYGDLPDRRCASEWPDITRAFPAQRTSFASPPIRARIMEAW